MGFGSFGMGFGPLNCFGFLQWASVLSPVFDLLSELLFSILVPVHQESRKTPPSCEFDSTRASPGEIDFESPSYYVISRHVI